MLQFYFIGNQAMYNYGFQGITHKSSSEKVFSVLFSDCVERKIKSEINLDQITSYWAYCSSTRDIGSNSPRKPSPTIGEPITLGF